MGRWDREKEIKALVAQGPKGVRIKAWISSSCPHCHCLPCQGGSDCQAAFSREAGEARVKAKNQAAANESAVTRKAEKRKRKKRRRLTWSEASKIRKTTAESYRSKHPTASDSKVKREANAAVRAERKRRKKLS